jgi:Protein of unknown function (DUF2934)
MASTSEKKPAVAKKPAAKKVATKKPAASKPAASKAAASKPKAAKKIATKKTSKAASTKIGAAERYRMVETAAYFIAERNGFKGNSADNWIAAEAQIAKMLAK